MKKFFKYYKNIIRIKFMQFMEYRGDFLMTSLSGYAYNILAIIFISVLFDNFDKVGNWSRYEGLFLLGYSQLTFYHYLIFFSSVDDIESLIREGGLDQFLLRPINSLLAIIFDSPSIIQMLPNLVFAVFISGYALVHSEYSILMFILSILLLPISVILFTAYEITCSLIAFWVTEVQPINQFNGQMLDNAKIPIEVFPKSIQLVLKTIVPLSLASYFPASIVFFGFNLNLFLYYICSTCLFCFLTLFLWRKGLSNYSSVSS